MSIIHQKYKNYYIDCMISYIKYYIIYQTWNWMTYCISLHCDWTTKCQHHDGPHFLWEVSGTHSIRLLRFQTIGIAYADLCRNTCNLEKICSADLSRPGEQLRSQPSLDAFAISSSALLYTLLASVNYQADGTLCDLTNRVQQHHSMISCTFTSSCFKMILSVLPTVKMFK